MRGLVHTVELDGKSFAAARAVIACAELESVRIIRSKFSSSLHSVPVSEVELATSTSRTTETKDGAALIISLDLGLRGYREDDLLLDVSARIEAQYSVPEESVFSSFQLRSFARANGMLNVWPYWRDFVQSSVQRAGLPSLTLPLFRVLNRRLTPTVRSEPAPLAK